MLASSIVTYQDLLKDAKEPLQVRLAMVKRYKRDKEFHTTHITVHKWIKRFSGVHSSLKNCLKAPKQPFRQIGERTEDLLVRFRKATSLWAMTLLSFNFLTIGFKDPNAIIS